VLLHPTSLPGPYGAGDVGPAAERFLDLAARAGLGAWQVLPIGPAGFGDCPYNSPSGFALSPELISPDWLAEEGLVSGAELRGWCRPSRAVADHRHARRARAALLEIARRGSRRSAEGEDEQGPGGGRTGGAGGWLEAHAWFMAIRERLRAPWWRWPEPWRHGPAAIERLRAGKLGDEALRERAALHRYTQRVAAAHWGRLRGEARRRGVSLWGDLPIYPAYDSADVWSRPELFQLDARGWASEVSGAPPDAFCPQGQKWGHALYRWSAIRGAGYAWWVDRLGVALERFDAVRLDHFAGLDRYWSVDAESPDASRGRWRLGPGAGLLRAVFEAMPGAQLFAEDLGDLRPEAHRLRERWGLPGVRVAVDGLGEGDGAEAHRPHRQGVRCVAYSSTHDTPTALGWLAGQSRSGRARACRMLGATPATFAGAVAAWTLGSAASGAVLAMQDVLGLGVGARMNTPGEALGQWRWRMKPGAWGVREAEALRERVEFAGRGAWSG
jgi:4-alpha-glucanotransferase